MCDYSLHHVKTRPAKVGDKLTTRDFGLGTRGFAALEDESVAVCVLPGTELSFAREVECVARALVWSDRVINHKTAARAFLFLALPKNVAKRFAASSKLPRGIVCKGGVSDVKRMILYFRSKWRPPCAGA
jgi:hypothetical protein